MKSLNYYIFALALALIASSGRVNAQYTEDFRARSVLEKSYTDVKGSPYLNDEWIRGVVKLSTGTSYKDIPLKFDQVSGELLFQDKSGATLTFADQVLEFKLGDRFYRFLNVTEGNSPAKAFYEVLYEGNTILLKDISKKIVEHRAYNSATTVKSILENPLYYVMVDGQMTRIKKDKKSVLALFSSKATELDRYIAKNKLNVKEDSDLIQLLAFYDSISAL